MAWEAVRWGEDAMARTDRIQRLERLRYERRGVGRSAEQRRLGPTLVSFLLLAALLVVGGQFALSRFSSALGPSADVATSVPVHVITFEVRQGDSLNNVADRLASQGVIPSGALFTVLARLKGLDANLTPGVYKVHAGGGIQQAVTDLMPINTTNSTVGKTGAPAAIGHVRVTIPEGYRIEEIAQRLQQKKVTDAKTFIAEARHSYWDTSYYTVLKGRPAGASLEGYLYPETYDFEVYTDTVLSARHAIGRMLDTFKLRVKPDVVTGFKKQFNTTDGGVALYKGLAIAAMVQREGEVASEFPHIAGVYMNRLRPNNGQTKWLDVDAVLRYGLGYDKVTKSWWGAITPQDKTTQTQYNPFGPDPKNAGLHFGPICNPGLTAIKAAAHPAKTADFYYLAKGDGSGTHGFARNLDEFNQLMRQYGYTTQ